MLQYYTKEKEKKRARKRRGGIKRDTKENVHCMPPTLIPNRQWSHHCPFLHLHFGLWPLLLTHQMGSQIDTLPEVHPLRGLLFVTVLQSQSQGFNATVTHHLALP